MKYLLDTNICIHFFRGRFNLLEKFQSVKLNNCAISEITVAELIYGAESSRSRDENIRVVEKFCQRITILPIFDSIYLYGKEKARLRKTGTMISDFDLLIGCTALEKELIMVTENIGEFERISDLKIENWIDRSIG
jgi:tRNA(fMet)-specific endonuclease VapC